MNKRQKKKNIKKNIIKNYENSVICIKKVIWSKKHNRFDVLGFIKK